MTIKERIEIEAKAYAFGDQNEHRTFLTGADLYRKAVIEMLENRSNVHRDMQHATEERTINLSAAFRNI